MAPPHDTPARLGRLRKAVYASGDFTLNTALAAMSLIYASYFLIEVAGLRPALAGLVPLVGRVVDAFTDPLMGRLSDHTRWRGERRRPYFLLGAIPFGASFAMLWIDPPLVDQFARFAYYAGAYCLLSLATTVLSVPYLALLPEMAVDYDERTSLNGYRNGGTILGIAAAIAIRPLAESFGGGAVGFAWAGLVFAFVLSLPWLAVHRVSFERPQFAKRPTAIGFVEGVRIAARHHNFRHLIGAYLCGRIAIDLTGTMLVLYFTHYIGRSADFEKLMMVFLPSVGLSLPIWLFLARRNDKTTLFRFGSVWWSVFALSFLLARPEWESWMIFVGASLTAFGYAAVDLMPWAMLGDVIDEDDLETGERREGLYNGVFTFLRKLAGAVAVFLALSILDLAGLQPGGEQPESALLATRLLTSIAPGAFLLFGLYWLRDYRLTRRRHGEILEQIGLRRVH